MRTIARLVPAFLFCALFLFPSQARADNLVITGGSVSYPSFGANTEFNLQGQGVSIQGIADGLFSNTPLSRCGPVCVGGSPFTFQAIFADFAGPTTAVINGTTYTVSVSGLMSFTGSPLTIPNTGESLLTVTDSITLTGTLGLHELGHRLDQAPIFTYQLSGHGIASIDFVRIPDPLDRGRFVYEARNLNYNLNPVPEPATLLLLGTGLAGIAAKLRRTRKARKSIED